MLNICAWVVLLASIMGIMDTVYLFFHHVSDIPLVCPLKGKCEAVVESKWSKIFGVHVELFGLMYYVLMFLNSIAMLWYPLWALPVYLIFAMTLAAIIFAGYLLFIQVKVIKHYCFFCLISDGLLLIILIATALLNFQTV